MSYRKMGLCILLTFGLMLSGCGMASSASDLSGEDDVRANAVDSKWQKKVVAVCDKNCNYIYHMLSVAKCGYDNDYGTKYAAYHSLVDLETLKKYESELTVTGGEHIGSLYGLIVTQPIALGSEVDLKEYYSMIENMDFEKYYDKYYCNLSEKLTGPKVSKEQFISEIKEPYEDQGIRDEASEIAHILKDNYDIYMEKVWPESQKVMQKVVDEYNESFASFDYIGEWENKLGYTYSEEQFMVLLCNSIEGGAQAIDIGRDKDIFQISTDQNQRDCLDIISHEIGIFILMPYIFDESQKDTIMTAYDAFESLAEYYNMHIRRFTKPLIGQEDIIKQYEALQEKNPDITPRELFNEVKTRQSIS